MLSVVKSNQAPSAVIPSKLTSLMTQDRLKQDPLTRLCLRTASQKSTGAGDPCGYSLTQDTCVLQDTSA